MKNTLFLFVLLGSAICQHAYASYSDKVLVIIDNDVITQSEFDNRLKSVLADMQEKAKPEVLEALPKQLLDSMISDRLQLQEAKRRGFNVTDDEIGVAIERFANQQGNSVEQLRNKLRERGQAFAGFRQTVKESLTISRLNDYYTRSRVVVPAYEVDGYIEQNKSSVDDTEYQLAHILIKDPQNSLGLANQLVDQLRTNVATFEQLVLRYSQAADAQDGGVIGWRTLDQLPEVFAETVKGMSKGEVSDVLDSANGLHILKLLDIKGTITEIDQHKVQHILISAKTQVAKKQASKKVKQIKQRVLAGEFFEQMARIYSDDSVSAANGGDLGWVSSGEMVREFEQAFTQLPINQMSEPIETQYGVHLIKVIEKRKKNITSQLLRARAEAALRRQRSGREYQQWIRELREQAYIQYIDEPAP